MDVTQAAERFATIFPELYRRFHRRVHHTEYQLTSESLAVVRHMANAGPLTVTEAARHMDRSQAAMSELVGRLVGRGLLARMPDERDRRRVLIWPTEAGRNALESAQSVLAPELLAQALSQLPAKERRSLLDGLQTLLDTDPNPNPGDTAP